MTAPVLQTRGGRPRQAHDTRVAILEAGRALFLREGYGQVGVRDIARAARVDAALISRYFGSKEDLFAAVLDSGGQASDLTAGDRSGFGERIARDLLLGAPDRLAPLVMMLRSISSPTAAEVIRASSHRRFYLPLSAWLGGDDAEVRARLVAGLIMGLSVSLMIGGANLSPASRERLVDRLAATLQGLVDP